MLINMPGFYEFKYSLEDSTSEAFILISADNLEQASKMYLQRFPEDKFKFLSLRFFKRQMSSANFLENAQ